MEHRGSEGYLRVEQAPVTIGRGLHRGVERQDSRALLEPVHWGKLSPWSGRREFVEQKRFVVEHFGVLAVLKTLLRLT